MKRCLIVTGGKLDLAFARFYLERERFHLTIAVDGGLEAVQAPGLEPDYVVGDFDTVKPTVVEHFKKAGHKGHPIAWMAHPPEKNETDTELARSLAMELECSQIVFLGATGGRLDHTLGNLHALYQCMENGVEAWIVDAQNKIYLLDRGKAFDRDSLWGKYISFLPYTQHVRGITLKGFRYPLHQKNICRGQEVGLCISNELAGDKGYLDFTQGVLVCVESKD